MAPVEGKDPNGRQMSDFSERLKGARRDAGLEDGTPEPVAPLSLASYGLRLATELVAGVVVGAFIGWWVDKEFGTSPFGLLAFFALGFTAGLLNVVRAVKNLNARMNAGKPLPEEATPDDDDDDDRPTPEEGDGPRKDGG